MVVVFLVVGEIAALFFPPDKREFISSLWRGQGNAGKGGDLSDEINKLMRLPILLFLTHHC